jgi:hypothetical protein
MPEKVNGNKFSGKSNIASLNSGNSPIASKSAVQLNSTEQKLATLQKMADNSPYSQRLAQLKSLANKTTPSHQPVSQLSKDSHSLPDNVKQGVESLSGISMDDVKVHYNSAKPAQLNAHAYAQGTDIHIASGQEKHLPHEAWHVVQQKQGRVRPTTMMKAKVPVNDDAGLEKEADVMGARALQMKPFSLSDYKTEKSVQRKGIVQKVGKAEEQWNEAKAMALREGIDVGSNPDAKEDAESAVATVNEEKEKEEKSAVATVNEEKEKEEKSAEATAKKERISALKLSRLKFNFAGSGQDTWVTRKDKYDESGENKKGFEEDKHVSGGKKMVKEKENKNKLGTKSLVVEYAGPIEKYGKKGATDSGKNSTKNNLKDAKKTFIKELSLLKTFNKDEPFKIKIDIKGFSRGAATASVFAVWIKSLSEYKDNVEVNLLLQDPVHGKYMVLPLKSKMPDQVDTSSVLEEDEEGPINVTGTTLVMPVKTGYPLSCFAPQKISGYQTIILIYGSNAGHNSGLGQDEKNTLYYGEIKVKGMGLTKIPRGIYKVDADKQPLDILPLTLADKDKILEHATVFDKRDKVIKDAINKMLGTKE